MSFYHAWKIFPHFDLSIPHASENLALGFKIIVALRYMESGEKKGYEHKEFMDIFE